MRASALLLAGLVALISGMPPALADVPIVPAADARKIVLDFDRDTENYFAAVQWGDRTGGLFISTDQGSSWTVGSSFGTASDIIDIDLTVAGDYAYLGFTQATASGLAEIMRYSTATGDFDSSYGGKVVVNVSPLAIVDIALASDQDGADGEIYYALIADDGALRFFFDSSSDGTTFTELSPGISNAASGLDLTFNPGSLDHDVFFSYLDASSRLRVWRSFPWEEVLDLGVPQAGSRTAISAYGDRVIACFELAGAVMTQVSWTAGALWNIYPVDSPDPGEGDYGGCDVTARGGRGFAVTYVHEEGAFDPVYLRRESDSFPPFWDARVTINEFGAAIATSLRTSLNWLPPDSYGVAYVEGAMGTPYFDRFAIPIFADGFE